MYHTVCASGSQASSGRTIDISGRPTRSLKRQWSLLTNLTMPSSSRWWYGTWVYGAWMRTVSRRISVAGRACLKSPYRTSLAPSWSRATMRSSRRAYSAPGIDSRVVGAVEAIRGSPPWRSGRSIGRPWPAGEDSSEPDVSGSAPSVSGSVVEKMNAIQTVRQHTLGSSRVVNVPKISRASERIPEGCGHLCGFLRSRPPTSKRARSLRSTDNYGGDPGGIRTRDLDLERVASWARLDDGVSRLSIPGESARRVHGGMNLDGIARLITAAARHPDRDRPARRVDRQPP